MDALQGLRIVICQPFFARYSGSEVITLELAEALTANGSTVSVITHHYTDMMAQELATTSGAQVFTTKDAQYKQILEESPPDLVWIHQGFIPDGLLSVSTRFVFAHLSSFNAFEFPFAPALERTLAERIYFVSAEAEDAHRATGIYDDVEPSRIRLFHNPAPYSFHKVGPRNAVDSDADGETGSSIPQSLLIVSNHLPEEVITAVPLIEQAGVQVTVVGAPQEGVRSSQQRVTAELLAQYDAVMSIGKTVQYSLCAGRPVYCYDYFGGPGWLSPTTLEKAEYHNYSGRGFERRSAEELRDDIIGGFATARGYVRDTITHFRKNYSYDRVLADLADLCSRPPRERTPLAPDVVLGFTKAHETVQNFGTGFFIGQAMTEHSSTVIREQEAEIARAHEEIRLKEQHIGNLEANTAVLRAENSKLRGILAEFERSISWQITRPLRSTGEILRRLFRR